MLMSGHSKWSKVKHQKEATDATRGKIFTKLANAIIVAVREGGGNADPASNFRLRLAVEKARAFNMPKEKIERAIERACGANAEDAMEQVVYEAFAPGGIGLIIEAVTNNKQRTVSEVKNILERGGGALAAIGAVSHLFKHMGLLTIEKKGKSFDEIFEIAIDAGATDIEEIDNEMVDVYTESTDLHKVKEKIEKQGIVISDFGQCFRPTVTVPVNEQSKAESVLRLISALEEIEDVHKVYANFDIPEKYLN